METQKVRPGEIISSELMNFILNKLEELEDQVAGLGQLNEIRINEVTPTNGAPVGTLIQIFGSNFLHPSGNNIIRISGRLVTEFAAPSTSGIITCRVPDSIDITAPEGEEVVIHIENETFGATESTYRLFPASSQPEIIIDSVLTESGSTNLNTNEPAIVTGSNFSTDIDLNQIQFEWVVAEGNNVIYEVLEKTFISQTPEQTQIRIEVPDVTEIPNNQVRPVTLAFRFGDRQTNITVIVRGRR